jgi:predicted RNase H-like HicB family nuclease/uncharacterized damage-inducible protein DinB
MATPYALYLESGPRRRKTMVHVLDVLGCAAVGPTTAEALAATPEAIRAYRRFLRRCGEAIDDDAPVKTHIAEHITEGIWIGNGSPYITFGPDLQPLTAPEIARYIARHQRLREEFAAWAEHQTDESLDNQPAAGGRTTRAVLLHVLGPTGGYLSSALGSAPGFSAVHGAAERGELPLAVALRRTATMVAERLANTTPEEWETVRELPSGHRTLRKAIRRLLEHDWEHIAELSQRPGGPVL